MLLNNLAKITFANIRTLLQESHSIIFITSKATSWSARISLHLKVWNLTEHNNNSSRLAVRMQKQTIQQVLSKK